MAFPATIRWLSETPHCLGMALCRKPEVSFQAPHTLSLSGMLLSRWPTVAMGTGITWATFCLIIFSIPQSYRAQALVVPAETTGIAASSLLAPLAPIYSSVLDPKPTGNFAVYLGALRAREMAAALRSQTSLPEVLQLERFMTFIRRFFPNLEIGAQPVDDDEIMRWLEANSSATPQPNSIIWQIEVRHRNPTLALSVLRTVHVTAEARVRDEMSSMVARRIAWLQDRAASETDQAIRTTLYEMLAQAYRHSAILAADDAVAARIVSAPAVEDRPSVPNRIFLAALGLLASFFLALSAFILKFAVQKSVVLESAAKVAPSQNAHAHG